MSIARARARMHAVREEHGGPRRAGRLCVGTSGYQYKDWRGRFYPEDLPQERWLGFYAARFDTVEINNSFYKLPSAEVFARWRESVPRDFLFAVKLSRYATHFKRLRDPEQPLALFLERAERLGAKLGPILVQLPPRFEADPERLAAFLAAAPRRQRWAIEVRDASWLRDDVYELLRRHGAALCVHDLLPAHPRVVTADFTYLRFHGSGRKYGGSYPRSFLSERAREIRADLRRGLDVYAYFNNDADGHAVANATTLLRSLARARARRPGRVSARGRSATPAAPSHLRRPPSNPSITRSTAMATKTTAKKTKRGSSTGKRSTSTPRRSPAASRTVSKGTVDAVSLARAPVSATLPFRGLKAAQDFYSKKLGLERLHGSVKDGYLEFQAGGGTVLQLFESNSDKKSDNTAATFEVSDLDRVMAALRKRGVVFEEYDLPGIKTENGVATAEGMGKAAWLKDPDGNVIALHEAEH